MVERQTLKSLSFAMKPSLAIDTTPLSSETNAVRGTGKMPEPWKLEEGEDPARPPERPRWVFRRDFNSGSLEPIDGRCSPGEEAGKDDEDVSKDGGDDCNEGDWHLLSEGVGRTTETIRRISRRAFVLSTSLFKHKSRDLEEGRMHRWNDVVVLKGLMLLDDEWPINN